MEQNTVILSLEKYEEFKSLEQTLDASKYILAFWDGKVRSLTESEVVDRLKEKICDLMDENHLLKHPKVKETTVKDLDKMSLLALIKWKLENRK